MDKKCPISQVRTDEVFIRPDHPSICTWSAGTKEKNPHFCKPLLPRPKIAENILDVVGQTPLVKLNKIPKAAGVKCNVYVKCEFLNPGGSVKDRIAVRMIEEAEKKGLLKPGDTIIEPTSGNTGIGLAMGAAVKGYRCIIVLPEKMSNEKVNTLKALGAEVVRTPTEAPLESPENLIQVAYRLQKEIPNSIVLDQYRNKGNPLAHYDGTATEIIEQCNGKIDMIVMGAGTGGTITGIARKIRETIPTCKIVAVDPEGSTLAQLEENEIPSDVTFYEVEGIGYDFMPTVLDIGVIDKWIKVNDNDAFPMARRLIREEGLLCGGSSGAAVAKAMEVAKELKPDQNCIIILPDNIRNYLSKFVSDEWLEARNFKESINTYGHEWWLNKLTIFEPKTPPLSINIDTCVDSAIEIMKANSLDFIPVLELDGHVKGAVTMQNITLKLINKSLKYSDPISKCVTKCIKVNRQKSFIGHVSRILEKEPFVIVVQHEMIVNYDGKEKLDKESLVATITQKDIFNYITSLDARETKNGN